MRIGLGLSLSSALVTTSGGSPSAFNPTTVVASPTVWLTGRLGVTDSGGTFTWADQGSGAHNFTNAGAAGLHPTGSASPINGFAGVRFTAASVQSASGGALSNFVGTTAGTIITVFKAVSTPSTNSATAYNNPAIYGDVNASIGLFVRSAPDILVDGIDSADHGPINLGSLVVNQTYIVTSRHSAGTTLFASVNGGAESSCALGTINTTQTFKLGVGFGGVFFDGIIYEHVSYSTDIGATNLASIVSGYRTMYSI